MAAIGISDIRGLLEAAITAVSVMGGLMAYFSDRAASATVSRQTRADVVSRQINEGLAVGFDWGVRLGAIAFMIVLLKLLVCIFGSQQKIRRAGTVTAVALGVAIIGFGAPPVILFVAAFGGAELIARTQDWMRRHPESH